MKRSYTKVLIICLFLIANLQLPAVYGQINPCPIPQGLNATGITSTSATLNWTATGALAYQVSYCPPGNPTWISFTTNSNSKLISNLAPSTTYAYCVRSVCTASGTIASTGPWSVIAYFTTLPQQTTCHANFTFTPLPVANPISLNGFQFTSTSTGINNTTVYLWNFGDNTTSNLQNPIHYVAQSGTYNVCLTITTINSAGVTCTDTHCVNIIIPGSISCNVPTNLAASNIASHKALLSWSNTGAIAYHVRYKSASTASWIVKNATTNSLTLIGLSSATAYECQVQSVCSGLNGTATVSAWSASLTFITSNSPSPFVSKDAVLHYYCDAPGSVDGFIELFDVTGVKMSSVNSTLNPGDNEIRLDNSGMKDGLYILRVNTGTEVITQKVMYIR